MAKIKVHEEVTIRIRPMDEKIQVEEKIDGVTSVKSISIDDLVDCFQGSIRDEKQFESGFLPENCLSFTLSNNTKSLVIWHPHLRVDYIYYKTTYENFPLPRMVFCFDLNTSGRVTKCRVAVVDDERPKPSTQIYQFPFSNVYNDSSICIGAANTLPTYKNLWALGGLPHHILGLPNNDHNYDRTDNKLRYSYRELLDHMQDKDLAYYYEHVLIPRKGKTLQHFINDELGGRHG